MPPIKAINEPKDPNPNLVQVLAKLATLHHLEPKPTNILDINGTKQIPNPLHSILNLLHIIPLKSKFIRMYKQGHIEGPCHWWELLVEVLVVHDCLLNLGLDWVQDRLRGGLFLFRGAEGWQGGGVGLLRLDLDLVVRWRCLQVAHGLLLVRYSLLLHFHPFLVLLLLVEFYAHFHLLGSVFWQLTCRCLQNLNFGFQIAGPVHFFVKFSYYYKNTNKVSIFWYDFSDWWF